MKTFSATLALCLLLALPANAQVIKTISTNNVIRYASGGVRVTMTLGGLSIPKEYGVFAHVNYYDKFRERGGNVTEGVFFRAAQGQFVREGKALYFDNGEKRILLAKKRFLGFKPVDGVTLRYKVDRSNTTITVQAWIEIK